MQQLLNTEPEETTTTGRQRLVIILGALGVTVLLLGVAVNLGLWAYAYRLQAGHDARLARLLAQTPTEEQVTQGLALQGDPLLAAPNAPDDLARTVERWAGPRRPEVEAKSARSKKTRVYRASEMACFVYFDADDVMRDFTCVRQR
jgi:hypothetical protein